jgi:putative ABC transport system substrate-binding protein
MGIRLRVLSIRSEGDLEAAFATLVKERIGAFIVAGDALFTSHRRKIVGLAGREHLLGIYPLKIYAAAGGLMSYGASQADAYRHATNYVGKILEGARISDLPFILPTKYELVINLKAAKAQAVDIPTPLLALADEVIE